MPFFATHRPCLRRRCSEKSNKRSPEIRAYFGEPYFAVASRAYFETRSISQPDVIVRKVGRAPRADLNPGFLNPHFR